MTLGEKIRQARLDAHLSQRELCGDVITRNMLSQIENGSARPSMDTLQRMRDGGKLFGKYWQTTGNRMRFSAGSGSCWKKWHCWSWRRRHWKQAKRNMPGHCWKRNFRRMPDTRAGF